MARDFAQIEKAALAMRAATIKDETTSLPPGYISGFYVTLKQDYTVTISAGTAYVAGRAVKSETEHMLEKADWVVPRLDTPNHYYVYLAKTGAIYVDLVQPKFNPGYGYYEQPDYGWRAIGKLFVKGNDIIYAVRQVEVSGSTVTVAAAGYTGEADYYCTGTADDILINAAILYVYTAYHGGTVRLVGGVFNTTAAVVLDDHITLEGSGATIKKNGNFDAVECVGTSGTHKHNVRITGDLTITRDAADTSETWLVRMYYVDDLRLSSFCLGDPYYGAIDVGYCSGCCVGVAVDGSSIDAVTFGIMTRYSENFIIDKNYVRNLTSGNGSAKMAFWDAEGDGSVFTNNIAENIGQIGKDGTGIYLGASSRTVVGRNKFINCSFRGIDSSSTSSRVVIHNNHCLDNGNLISHGDCESTGAGNDPHITSDGGSLSNATFARSAVQKYAGSYSYLFTKTNAAGTAAYAWLVDNNTTTDMHTLSIIQGAYKLKARVFVPSGGILFGEVNLIVSQYYGGAWNDTLVACANLYDAWQAVEATMTMNAACTGVRVGFVALAAAAINEIFYVDNVQFIPQGVTNEHQQNFYDAGTDTATGGNSWQSPVAGEPSIGTPHPAPLNGSNLRQIYTGTPAVTASTTEVDVSAYVPAGTKEIFVEGSIKVGSNTVAQLCASKTSTANYDNGIWTVQGYGGAAFMYFPFSGPIKLDANRKFWIYLTNAAILAVDMYIVDYNI